MSTIWRGQDPGGRIQEAADRLAGFGILETLRNNQPSQPPRNARFVLTTGAWVRISEAERLGEALIAARDSGGQNGEA